MNLSSRPLIEYGIDINDSCTVFSYYIQNSSEPVTISAVAGSGIFQIPTSIARYKDREAWAYGEDARRQVRLGTADGVTHLFRRAMKNEPVIIGGKPYESADLLSLFLIRLFAMAGQRPDGENIGRIVFTSSEITGRTASGIFDCMKRMHVDRHKVSVIDHAECFCFYAMKQDPRIFAGDVMLWDYSGRTVRSYLLHRNTGTTPQTLMLEEHNEGLSSQNRDADFDGMIQKALENRYVTGVYLTGNGFDGDWMKLSLQRLCRGRRVFIGKNLYSKGACYAAAVRDHLTDWPFVYIGENELKVNFCLKVSDLRNQKLITLLSAGENRYDAYGECEVILNGDPQISIFLKKPDGAEVHEQLMQLKNLPKRPERTTRLRISAEPLSDTSAKIIVRDLGFGELFPASGMQYKFTAAWGREEENHG